MNHRFKIVLIAVVLYPAINLAQFSESYNHSIFSLGASGGMSFSYLSTPDDDVKSGKLGYGGINVGFNETSALQLRFENQFHYRGFDVQNPVGKVRYLFYDGKIIQYYRPSKYFKIGAGLNFSAPLYNTEEVDKPEIPGLTMKYQTNAVISLDLILNHAYALNLQYNYNPKKQFNRYFQFGILLWITKSHKEQYTPKS